MSQSTEKYREDAPFSLFSFSGCVSRQTYWALFIVLVGSMSILGFGLGWQSAALENESFSKETVSLISIMVFPLSILVSILAGWIGLATSVKRYRDANFSPWLVLLNIVAYLGSEIVIGSQITISLNEFFPFINIISNLCGVMVLILNGFFPSVNEGNKYCKSRNNLSTKAIRWIYIIFLSPILLFFVAIVVLKFIS